MNTVKHFIFSWFFPVLVFTDIFWWHIIFADFQNWKNKLRLSGWARARFANGPIFGMMYRIIYYMRCVMAYIQSTISLQRHVNLNLSNKFFLNILISVMAECLTFRVFKCYNKMCFNFYLFTQLLSDVSAQIRPTCLQHFILTKYSFSRKS